MSLRTDAGKNPDLKCPVCECRHVYILQEIHGAKRPKLKFECRACGKRFSTIDRESEEKK